MLALSWQSPSEKEGRDRPPFASPLLLVALAAAPVPTLSLALAPLLALFPQRTDHSIPNKQQNAPLLAAMRRSLVGSGSSAARATSRRAFTTVALGREGMKRATEKERQEAKPRPPSLRTSGSVSNTCARWRSALLQRRTARSWIAAGAVVSCYATTFLPSSCKPTSTMSSASAALCKDLRSRVSARWQMRFAGEHCQDTVGVVVWV